MDHVGEWECSNWATVALGQVGSHAGQMGHGGGHHVELEGLSQEGEGGVLSLGR